MGYLIVALVFGVLCGVVSWNLTDPNREKLKQAKGYWKGNEYVDKLPAVNVCGYMYTAK